MSEPVRAFDLADPTPQPVIMRLGWSSPPIMSPPGAYMSICPAKEVWVSPYMEYLHRHYLGCELNPEYVRMAERRIADMVGPLFAGESDGSQT
jgi:hypothetical protein